MMFALPGILDQLFDLSNPSYCQLDTTGLYDILHSVTPEEGSSNYCPFATSQTIFIYEVSPPSFLSNSATTALWLDANDSATITLVSGGVSQWNDKSGNGRNATQSTAAYRPVINTLNGKNVLNFSGNNQFLKINSLFFIGINFSMFVVVAPTNLTNRMSIFTNGNNEATGMFWCELHPTQGFNTAFTGTFTTIPSTFAETTLPTLFSITKPSGAVHSVFRNGNAVTLSTNLSTNYSNTSQPSLIGLRRESALSQDFNGGIAEIIVIPSVLSQSDRELVEGYLAWKWGLVTNLPSNHPYKNDYPDKTLVGTQTISIFDFTQAP